MFFSFEHIQSCGFIGCPSPRTRPSTHCLCEWNATKGKLGNWYCYAKDPNQNESAEAAGSSNFNEGFLSSILQASPFLSVPFPHSVHITAFCHHSSLAPRAAAGHFPRLLSPFVSSAPHALASVIGRVLFRQMSSRKKVNKEKIIPRYNTGSLSFREDQSNLLSRPTNNQLWTVNWEAE